MRALLAMAAVVLLAGGAGAWRTAAALNQPNQFSGLYGKGRQLHATVLGMQKPNRFGSSVAVSVPGLRQRLQLSVDGQRPLAIGDEIIAVGTIKPLPADDPEYARYLLGKNIRAEMSASDVFVLSAGRGWLGILARLQSWRGQLLQAVRGNVSDPALSGLLLAIMLGDTRYMAAGQAAAFNQTGTAHMIAISGYKLTLLLVALSGLLRRCGRVPALLASCALIAAYLCFSDFADAVWRAALMSCVLALAGLLRRRYELWRALLFAAAAILLANPLAWYDLGFIFSFFGIGGIVLFAQPVHEWAGQRLRLPEALGIREAFSSTTAAQLATMPIMIAAFGIVPFTAPLANLLVLPLLAPLVLGGYAAAIPGLGKFAGMALAPLLWYVQAVPALLLKIPGAAMAANISPVWAVAWYALVISVSAVLPRR